MSDVSTTGSGRVRVILAKPGLDGHDRGAKVGARGLRDAGFEVIYTGLRQTPRAVAMAALQENADIICLSILSGAHVGLCDRLRQELDAMGVDVPVVVGGIVPESDEASLRASGVKAIFGPGSSLPDICETVGRLAQEHALDVRD